MVTNPPAGRHRQLAIRLATLLAAVSLGVASPLVAEASMTFTTTAGWRVLNVPQIFQSHGLSCEAAALQMALAYQGHNVSQDALLNAMPVDRRGPTWDIAGNFHWSDPYDVFVGNPDGSELAHTGYGTYYPPVVRAANAYGGSVIQAGEGIQPPTLYQAILSGHPVVAWVAFDWKWHQVSHYTAWDGDRVQFGSPYEHAVTLIGVTTDNLLVNNPWFGRQWIPKSTFEASYGTFNHMAVIFGPRANDPGPNTTSTPYQGVTPVPQDTYHGLAPARILDTRDGTGAAAPGPLGNDATLALQVAGSGGVPAAGASAVVLNVTAVTPSGSSFLTVYPSGTPRPNTSNLNWVPGKTVPNLVETPIGPDGKVAIYNLRGTVHVVVDVEGWFGPPTASPTAGLFNGLTPARLLDTRDGTGGFRGSLGQASTLNLQVSGRGGVPAAGVTAVALNVTVTNPTAPSFLTAYPSGTPRPNASNLNFVPGQTVANRVIVPLGTSGQISLFNFQGSTNLVADVSGWFTDGSTTTTGSHFASLTPQRILDTRNGLGAVPPSGTGTIQLADTAAIGVTAILTNVTATNASSSSFLTLWPGGGSRPTASDLNFVAGDTNPNLVLVKVGVNSTVDFYSLTGYVDVVVDLVGYFGPVG